MSEPRYRDWILETIDSLRSRKARPDLERICRMVRRRYGWDADRTCAELEKLIQEQTVLRVSYKGSISYRNAAKVQRKSRKKPEPPPPPLPGEPRALPAETQGGCVGDGGGGGAHGPGDSEDAREPRCFPERTEAARCPDPPEHPQQPERSGGTGETPPQREPDPNSNPSPNNNCPSPSPSASSPASGNGGARSPARDRRQERQKGGSAAGKTRAARGAEGGSAAHEGSGDKSGKSCALAHPGSGHPPRHKQHATLKPGAVRLAAKGGRRGGAEPDGADLGDRLVASVRTLAEKSRGGGAATTAAAAAAAARGHAPLGLKEILGFLSSQERLAQEKLTRSRVKVVLEREVARGRLRRTRFGNITLPVSARPRPIAPGAPKSSARALKSAPRERPATEKVELREEEPMETHNAEEEGGKCSRRGHDGGNETPCSLDSPSMDAPDPTPIPPPLLPCPTVQSDMADAHPGPTGTSQPPSSSSSSPSSSSSLFSSSSSCVAPKQEGGAVEMCPGSSCPAEHEQQELQADTGGAEGGLPLRAVCPSTGGTELGVEENAVTPDQLASNAQDQVMAEPEEELQTSCVPANGCSDFKVEGGVASCLLTPTSSPQDLGAATKEQRLNGEVMVKMEKSAQNPVEWTVSDVVSYFVAAGFPEQAAAFRTQEIDGKSLLLMQRNDVLTGLSIRLGPALKIYERHVKVLQRSHFQDDSALC
ncbi:atherin isoform X2 [Scleropages formosus]|uniref:atherin isoform X2 n=1 Tax=Scleropages formosus TaxID=113540 RepID=UPI0010FA7908|nr:atherin-like isoform X2 [Scleropages formosus]